jgi:hypothetical protein
MDSTNDDDRKKMIFDSMSPRRQKHILKKGYEKWDPFSEPKDPIDMRMDRTKRTSQTLIGDFFKSVKFDEHGDDYRKGAYEICLGIINEDEKFLGMFEFACWYKEELIKYKK